MVEASGELVQDTLPLLGLPIEHQGLEEAPAWRPESGPHPLLTISPPRRGQSATGQGGPGHSLPPQRAERYRRARSRLWPSKWKKDRYSRATVLLKSSLWKEVRWGLG